MILLKPGNQSGVSRLKHPCHVNGRFRNKTDTSFGGKMNLTPDMNIPQTNRHQHEGP